MIYLFITCFTEHQQQSFPAFDPFFRLDDSTLPPMINEQLLKILKTFVQWFLMFQLSRCDALPALLSWIPIKVWRREGLPWATIHFQFLNTNCVLVSGNWRRASSDEFGKIRPPEQGCSLDNLLFFFPPFSARSKEKSNERTSWKSQKTEPERRCSSLRGKPFLSRRKNFFSVRISQFAFKLQHLPGKETSMTTKETRKPRCTQRNSIMRMLGTNKFASVSGYQSSWFHCFVELQVGQTSTGSALAGYRPDSN